MNDPGPLPFDRLVVIEDSPPRSAALNMALDEALLGGLDHDPILRVYRWERPAVSVGCFDPADPVLPAWPDHELVRRWTGGGIVEHGNDLTFSLLVPRPLPLAMLPAAESYRSIHAAVAAALERIGYPSATLQTAAIPHAGAGSRACFENPVTHDLLIAGRKVAGGAQRRTRRGLLHQGSVQAGLADAMLPGGVAWRALADALPRVFGRAVERRCPTDAELDGAEALAAAKYRNPAWLRRF